MDNGAATKQGLENLRGFAAYAQSNELRMRRVEAGMLNLHGDDDAMNQRLAKVESRLLETEMKVMGGPQA